MVVCKFWYQWGSWIWELLDQEVMALVLDPLNETCRRARRINDLQIQRLRLLTTEIKVGIWKAEKLKVPKYEESGSESEGSQ
jgi:hypothetical protein